MKPLCVAPGIAEVAAPVALAAQVGSIGASMARELIPVVADAVDVLCSMVSICCSGFKVATCCISQGFKMAIGIQGAEQKVAARLKQTQKEDVTLYSRKGEVATSTDVLINPTDFNKKVQITIEYTS